MLQSAFSAETTVDTIKMLILGTGHIPPVDSVREVDRRLKLCKNPEKVVGSQAYLARKAEEERKAEQKRNRKAEDYRKVAEDDDPFGDELAGENGGVADDDDDD
jgi:cyclin H